MVFLLTHVLPESFLFHYEFQEVIEIFDEHLILFPNSSRIRSMPPEKE
jgi:hypothetical protein